MKQKISIIGNLTADPVARTTPNGVDLASFTVAVNDKVGGQETSTFYRCTAWRKLGETILKYSHKGDMVKAEGRLTASTYTDKQGNTRINLDVDVSDFDFLVSHRPDGQQAAKLQKPAPMPVEDPDDMPY